MKHSDYWRGRFEQIEESLLQHGLDYYDDLEREYRRAARNIEKDLTVWYKRLAANNGISFAEAKQLLNKNELKEFHWTVDDYIKYGKENAINQAWVKQLENASARVHISRLEAIKLQVQQHAEVLYGNQLDGLDKTMRKLYADGYYHTAFEVQRGLNVGYNLHQIDDRRMAAVIAKPWAADGKNFSDRIWQDKNKLISNLHTELTQSTIRGDPPDKAIQTMVDKLKVSKNNAGRLVMTESAFFASASQKDCFKDLDVEQYEIIATLDSHTSSTCREMDGKVFKMSDYKPGITAPPFHCWCRSCTAPYFDDNKGERAARGEDGKTYHVPDMKYEDWKKVYVDKTTTPEDWQKAQGNGIIKEKFVAAKTIQEANKYAVEVLGIKHADYSGLHIDVINEWNKGMSEAFNKFPEVKSSFNFAGESHNRNSTLKPILRQYYLDEIVKMNPRVNIELLKNQVEAELKKTMNKLKVPSNSYAASWAPKIEPFKQVAGITFNSVQGKDIGKLLGSLRADVEKRFHPMGCDTVKSVFDHEIGHQLDAMLGISKIDSVRKIFDSKTIDQITNELSKYAWSNGNPNRYGEFIAEAWSEYCNNPNPRPVAKEMGEIIEEAYIQWKKKNL